MVALIISCTVVNAFTAFVGAGTAAIASHAPFWNFWLTWWVSDGLGILLVTPLIVAWIRSGDSLSDVRAGWVLESSLFISILIVGTWLTFHGHTGHGAFTPQPYMLVALFGWAAFRLGLPIVTLGLTVMAIIAVTSPAVVFGPLLWGGATLTGRSSLRANVRGVRQSPHCFFAPSATKPNPPAEPRRKTRPACVPWEIPASTYVDQLLATPPRRSLLMSVEASSG